MRRLRLVEERLQKIDEKQHNLEKRWWTTNNKRAGGGSGAGYAAVENPFVVSALQPGTAQPERVDLRSFRSNQNIVGAQQGQLRTVKRLADASAPAPTQQAHDFHYHTVLAQKQDEQFAGLFEAEMEEEMLAQLEQQQQRLQQNGEEQEEEGNQTKTKTRRRRQHGDEEELEEEGGTIGKALSDQLEARAIRRIVASDDQRADVGGAPAAGAHFGGYSSPAATSLSSPAHGRTTTSPGAPTTSPSTTFGGRTGAAAQSSSRSLLSKASNPAVSPYVNPRPAQVRQAQLRTAKIRAEMEEERRRRRIVAPSNKGSEEAERMTAHFFSSLPPVIPQNKTPLLAKEVARPRSSSAATRPGTGTSSRPQTAGSHARGATGGGRPPSAATRPSTSSSSPTAGHHDRAIFTKEFYYLNVRVVNTQARLTEWLFSVVITDVTNPARLLRHTFRNLRVNPQLFLVFHPPSNVVLSPVDDIPWVAAPEALFKHTLRIEVFATFPAHSKVVDSMVFFGDVLPTEEELVGGGGSSSPSASATAKA